MVPQKFELLEYMNYFWISCIPQMHPEVSGTEGQQCITREIAIQFYVKLLLPALNNGWPANLRTPPKDMIWLALVQHHRNLHPVSLTANRKTCIVTSIRLRCCVYPHCLFVTRIQKLWEGVGLGDSSKVIMAGTYFLATLLSIHQLKIRC